jgi:Flp pilus assembly pilin Flp
MVVVNSEVRMNAAIHRMLVKVMDCRGAGMVEYSLLVAFIGIALVVAVAAVGTALMGSFGASAEAVDTIIT